MKLKKRRFAFCYHKNGVQLRRSYTVWNPVITTTVIQLFASSTRPRRAYIYIWLLIVDTPDKISYVKQTWLYKIGKTNAVEQRYFYHRHFNIDQWFLHPCKDEHVGQDEVTHNPHIVTVFPCGFSQRRRWIDICVTFLWLPSFYCNRVAL